MSATDLGAGIVVVGASVAGTSAIGELRRLGYGGSITLIGAESHPPYTRPPLSKSVLKGADGLASVALPLPGPDVEMTLGVAATGLDPKRRVVRTTEGDVRYGGLVVATGARARLLDPNGYEEHVLRTVEDCRGLQAEIDRAQSVIMVGGGFLGMEIASVCRELNRDVTIVDIRPPLVAQLGEFLGDLIANAARTHGVSIVVSSDGVELCGEGRRAAGVRLANGEVLAADLVISAVGCRPNVEWLEASGLEIEGGVHVDAHCRVAPGIVAAGDVTRVIGAGGPAPRTPQWMSAVDQGRLAATSLLAEPSSAVPTTAPSYFWTEAFGLALRIAGPLPVAGQPEVLEGDLPAGPALIGWNAGGPTPTLVALNRKIAAPKLRRLAGAGASSD